MTDEEDSAATVLTDEYVAACAAEMVREGVRALDALRSLPGQTAEALAVVLGINKVKCVCVLGALAEKVRIEFDAGVDKRGRTCHKYHPKETA